MRRVQKLRDARAHRCAFWRADVDGDVLRAAQSGVHAEGDARQLAAHDVRAQTELEHKGIRVYSARSQVRVENRGCYPVHRRSRQLVSGECGRKWTALIYSDVALGFEAISVPENFDASCAVQRIEQQD